MESLSGTKTNIVGAQEWHDEIGAALQRCNWFVVILSPNAVKSPWVKNELLFSLNHHRYRKQILPVLHKKCKYERLSWTLSNFQIVDFTGSLVDGYRELLRVWGLGYKPKKSVRGKLTRGKRSSPRKK